MGKPLLFGTTDNFLKRFQIASLDELPDYEQLLQSIQVIESGETNETIKTDSGSLYNEFEISDKDEDIPEFLAGEQVKKIDGEQNA